MLCPYDIMHLFWLSALCWILRSWGLGWETENRMKTQPLPGLETIRKGWCHSLIQQHTKWDVVAWDRRLYAAGKKKKQQKKDPPLPVKPLKQKDFCEEKGLGSRHINRAQTGVIKEYAVPAHHILAAKLEQMCCLWNTMQMIKNHQ